MSKALAAFRGDYGRVFLFQLDRELVVHAHREGHLLFHIDGAPAQMIVEDRAYDLKLGNGVAVNPWQPHFFRPCVPGEETMVLVLYIDQKWFLQASSPLSPSLRYGRAEIEVDDFLHAAKHDMVRGMMDPYTETAVLEDRFRQLACGSYEQSWQWTPEAEGALGAHSKMIDFRIRKSIRLLAELPFEETSLDEVARNVGLSRAHFYRMFRDQIGVTPNVYLNALRMEKAIDRLLLTTDTVAEIGYDLGFSSQASFTRFFTSNGVLPPSEYRRAVVCEVA